MKQGIAVLLITIPAIWSVPGHAAEVKTWDGLTCLVGSQFVPCTREMREAVAAELRRLGRTQ